MSDRVHDVVFYFFFQTDPEAEFTVECEDFSLEASADCKNDYLKVNFKNGNKEK